MKKQDFYFDLPQELIAQYPLANRTDSRLLVHRRETDQTEHHHFKELPTLIESGDLLVMNNTKVIQARFYGTKSSGGHVEFLVERVLDDRRFLAHIKASKALKTGATVTISSDWSVEMLKRHDDLFECQSNGDVHAMLEAVGHMPLPPYIKRADEGFDQERYQTVYAHHKGSVAAPTAGLHFDEPLLQALRERGVQIAFTTLHVGAGTFRPVRCENILEHKMHCEQFEITPALVDAVNKTRALGKRVIAVGTTALRSLESAVVDGELVAGARETDIFIFPGYEFKICDGLITNFHLPESTLLMLVSAFIGYPQTMALYQEAIAQHYRFFSYGDACLLL
jgi:S-adenosylmethionine:tRNA ribosyltransferase-isomerase